MVGFSDSILIELSEAEIKAVISVVLEKSEISKIDNLRQRHPNIQFDCLLRGYIGEYAMTKWLSGFGIFFDKTNYLEDDGQLDIDFLYKGKNLELKTSLIPDIDETLERATAKRDIKLIIRGNTKIEDLKGDLHLQIIFNQRRKAKDEWLKIQEIDLKSNNVDDLYIAVGARKYKTTVNFVGWIDKESLVELIHNLPQPEKKWSFPQSERLFWSCKIRDANPPAALIQFLKNL